MRQLNVSTVPLVLTTNLCLAIRHQALCILERDKVAKKGME